MYYETFPSFFFQRRGVRRFADGVVEFNFAYIINHLFNMFEFRIKLTARK
jgi:hypothetical protein